MDKAELRRIEEHGADFFVTGNEYMRDALKNEKFIVGVLGVATNATVNFFEQWTKVFTAEKEWDRPRIIIDNNCTMPSRVRALLYNENAELLVEQMTDSIKLLIQAGCSKVLIACNTAHVFLDSIYEKFPPAKNYIVDIIDSCADHLYMTNAKTDLTE